MRALVLGATSWGCTLALQLHRAGTEVVVLCRDDQEAQRLAAERENHRLLPGIPLPEAIGFVAHPASTGSLDAVFLAVPLQRLRQNLPNLLALWPGALPPLVNAAKGLEVGTGLRGSQIITQVLEEAGRFTPVVALSGPNIAREIALEQAAATVVAGQHQAVLTTVRSMLMTPAFRVYTNDDIVGVELGGALKNIIAIGAGIGDAINAGANGRAAFLTRGLAEIARLGVAQGGQPLTFVGLAGLGDLIATAFSPHSRNHYVGEQLGHGRTLEEILTGMVHVVEGIETTRAAHDMALSLGVEMPIIAAMHRILFKGQPPIEAIGGLMTRAAQDELAGLPSPFPV